MNRLNRKLGFTMAEMLIVVAIIAVLGGVAFVAVNQHQRSLERLERDSVAREIFVAAQNHLTMAQGQGYLGLDGSNIKGNEDSEAGVYYFAVNKGSGLSNAAPATLLDLMLPLGAIDETVRGGGSYIIRYHYDTATVMDVFYCSADDRFGYDLSGTDTGTLASMLKDYGEGKESARRNFNGKVLGWYGGASAETLSKAEVYAPLIVVENADKLRVGIKAGTGANGETNPGTSSLQVIVTGVTSGAEKVFTIVSNGTSSATQGSRINSTTDTIDGIECNYEIILDDITTADMHFADITADVKAFIPGEDVVIQAIAFDNTQISNIAYSAEITVNSLFESLDENVDEVTGKPNLTASISSIRHLENMDKRISNVTDSRTIGEGNNAMTYPLIKAVQTSDMSWNDFKDNTNKASTAIQLYSSSAESTADGCYMPVLPTYALSYDGQSHSISEIKASYAGNAGLFETISGTDSVTAPTEIKNLALIDFDITQTGTGSVNAGALAGTLNNVNVENVIAYNSKAAITTGIVAEGGNAGGLIGSATGCEITKSAASLYVTSNTGNAGGLIGVTNGGKASGCYSGGHTHDGAYYDEDTNGEKTADYNIKATAGNAGGLIGVATSTPIDHSYATCSVTGQTAGGFVSSASAGISDCYATGLVLGTGTESITKTVNGTSTSATVAKDGAFAYSLSGAVSNCYYFEIINEREDDNVGYTYLTALGKEGVNTNIKPFDENIENDPTLEIYDNFFEYPGTPASAYDAKLIEYYDGKYNLPTVKQLGATLKESDDDDTEYFVATHYGDWPAPEIFVINAQ